MHKQSSILITGGVGFIGSHLCEKFLKLKYKVVCVDNLVTGQKKNINHLFSNQNFNFIKADVSKKSNYPLFSNAYSHIFHFASPAGPNPNSPLSYYQLPIKTYLVNSIATHYLLQLAKKTKARFIFASSSEVYGDPKEHPQKETYLGYVNPIGPRSCYDESKRFGEMATVTFGKKFNLKTKIIRIFNTYGPRMNPLDGRAIPLFITQALKNKPITVYGTGKQTRSFCYIDDLVNGIIKIAEQEKNHQVYNLGNPDEIGINQLVSKILKLTDSSSKIVHENRLRDDPKKRCPDINRVKNELNWQPKISLEKGLLNTIKYFKNS
jgi:dTDP-glucose 4,6-dehydratase